MRLQMLAKDSESKTDACQAVYLDEGGWFTVQGLQVDAETLGNVKNLLPGEGVVRIKPEIVLEAARQYGMRQ